MNDFITQNMTKNISTLLFFLLLIICAHSWEYEVVPCSDANCSSCDISSTVCTACADGFFLDDAAGICATCDSRIYDCVNCTLDNLTAEVTCDSCVLDEYPSTTAFECKTCFGLIYNCLTCVPGAKFQQATCSACEDGYELSEDRLSCSKSYFDKVWIIVGGSVAGGLLVVLVSIVFFM